MIEERIDALKQISLNKLNKIGHIKRYAKVLEFLNENIIALDVGCGCGYGSFILAKKAKRVIAIDKSKKAIDYACKNYKKDNIKYRIFDIEKDNALKLGYFDLITCFEVIEHIKNPDKAIKNLRKIIRPDGLLFISTPNKNNHYANNPYHVKEYDENEIIDLLENNGFEIKEIFGQYPIIGKISYFLGKIVGNKSDNFIITSSKSLINNLPYIAEIFSNLYKGEGLRKTSRCLYFIAKPKIK